MSALKNNWKKIQNLTEPAEALFLGLWDVFLVNIYKTSIVFNETIFKYKRQGDITMPTSGNGGIVSPFKVPK